MTNNDEAALSRSPQPVEGVAELRKALEIDLNVTDDELLRIRNAVNSDGDVRIWGKMLVKLVDAIRAARAALRSPQSQGVGK